MAGFLLRRGAGTSLANAGAIATVEFKPLFDCGTVLRDTLHAAAGRRNRRADGAELKTSIAGN